MNFSDLLEDYIKRLNCTAKELSNASGLSTTVLSRYRNGQRIPKMDSEQVRKLAEGIHQLAIKKGYHDLTFDVVFTSFLKLEEKTLNYEDVMTNLNSLISLLDINVNELARALNFDASYLSRIRSGQRKPANVEAFMHDVALFVSKRYRRLDDHALIASLTNINMTIMNNEHQFVESLTQWLLSSSFQSVDYINDFLKTLDEFNLDEYIKVIHFDELKVPYVPFQLPASKTHYGIDQMKKGELDFFKSTVLSKSQNPIFMCSDMPMADMAEDLEFSKKWIFAIAMSLKKGLHLNIIHNIDRPFHEMMLGLESWIPIYMTGQVSPYYLKGKHNQVYCHLHYVSGQYALVGECIDGFHNDGKYYLTNNKEDVQYYTKKAKHLLSKALPLMEIYRKENESAFHAFLNADIATKGKRHHILSSLPIYTMSEDLLCQILKRYSINQQEKEMIINYRLQQKERIEHILQENSILDEVFELSREEFEKYPMILSLSDLFFEKEMVYTYEDYLKHLQQTKDFCIKNANYTVKLNQDAVFRNIRISIHEGKWAMISKNKTPVIHFVIKHSKMLYAIEHFKVPVSEDEI